MIRLRQTVSTVLTLVAFGLLNVVALLEGAWTAKAATTRKNGKAEDGGDEDEG